MFCEEAGAVDIFDSLPAKTIPMQVKLQIASIITHPGNKMKLNMKYCQKQQGGVDCGLFAIANAISLCEGKDPGMLTYDQSTMRKHLEKCLATTNMVGYPELEPPRKLKVKTHFTHCSPLLRLQAT